MKIIHIPFIFCLILAEMSFRPLFTEEPRVSSCKASLSSGEPWTASQLLPPADLAATIKDSLAKKPIIFCVGPGAVIKDSRNIGPAKDTANLNKFKQQLGQLPKDTYIVIYCGCCPFDHCPNVRPAFTLLNSMGFTHHKLLDLEHNIKTDWINKGYPVNPN